jgi:hypothetical protein
MRYVAILCLLAITAPSFADNQVPANPSIECFAAMEGNPAFSSLKGKMMLGAGDTPLEILSNNAKPNKIEKVAISKFVSIGEKCNHLGDEWRSSYLPIEGQGLYDSYIVTAKENLADLYGRKITYGDYAKKRDAALAKFKTDIGALKMKLIAQQKADQDKKDQEAQRQNAQQQAMQQQYELQQAQIAAQQEQAKRAAILQLLSNQQQIQQQQQQNLYNVVRPPPVTTRCNTFGNQTNCSTQ